MHNLIHHGIKPATGAATGVADNDASINTTPHDLKDDEFKKQVLSMIPLGRLGEISDLMGPFVFLASDASSLMTGSSVLVDGGWTSR